jgi:4'-phosphopantetheinyl transferase
MTPSDARCPTLSGADIHVWTARLADHHHATSDLLRILDQEELARAAQFSFERDRSRFIQTHAIVRQILANYCDTDAATLTFSRNGYGKPNLVLRANCPRLQFSFSHSGSCCLLAVRLDHPIGVDVEKIRDLPQAIEIAQSYFAPAESKALASLRGAAQRDAFFVLWTHKEAAVKGLGIGLAANLRRLEFDFGPADGPRLVSWDGDCSVAQTWSTFRIDPAAGYVAAVASTKPIGSLTLHNWSDAAAC